MANKKLKWLESAKVDKVLSLCDWLLLNIRKFIGGEENEDN